MSERVHRRLGFSLALFGSLVPPDVLEPQTRAHILVALYARWPDVAHGRTPEESAQLGALDAAEATVSYMILTLEALSGVHDRARTRALRAAADRVLDGKHEPAAVEGAFRGIVAAADAGAVEPVSLVPTRSSPSIPAPVTRSERAATDALWWTMSSVGTIAGAISLAYTVDPAGVIGSLALIAGLPFYAMRWRARRRREARRRPQLSAGAGT